MDITMGEALSAAGLVIGVISTLLGFGFRQIEKMRVENRADHRANSAKLTDIQVVAARTEATVDHQGQVLDKLAVRLDDHIDDYHTIRD